MLFHDICLWPLFISMFGGGDIRGGGGGRGYSFVACLAHLTIDHASLSSRRSTVTTPIGSTSNIWALITRFFQALPFVYPPAGREK